jgi:hypothetical protein|tara:strand:+ start:67 stop:186 length:120 start_codon:yes stop_codon:yes gene_type:complete
VKKEKKVEKSGKIQVKSVKSPKRAQKIFYFENRAVTAKI